MEIFFYYNIYHILFRRDQTNKQKKKYSKYALTTIPLCINSQWEFILAIVQIYLNPDIFIFLNG